MKIKTINEESKAFKMEVFLNTFLEDQVILSQGEDTIYLEVKDIPQFVNALEELREDSLNK